MPGTRRFFIVCLGLALLLVIAVPALDSLLLYHALPDDVSAGFAVWQARDCAGCHTLDGAGAPYASDLTRISTSRSGADLRAFLAAPDLTHPSLSSTEIDQLLAFLQSISTQAGTLPTPSIHLSGG